MKNKIAKILLVSFYNEEAYGLRTLHSVLINGSFDAKMLFLKTAGIDNKMSDCEKGIFLNFLRENEFDLIAFSLVSSNFVLYKSLYNDIRSCGKHKILLGGWHVTLCPEDCISYCDFLCLGEGEGAILDVANNLFSEKTDVFNVWYNKGNIIKNPIRPLNKEINSLPSCLFDDKYNYCIENNRLTNKDPRFFSFRYGTMIGRGCPYHCTYCSNSYMRENVYKEQWSKIRYRNYNDVIGELRSAKDNIPELKSINFYDEIFIPNRDFKSEFFLRYKNEISLPFFCMFYPGTCNEELIKIMADSGLAGVWMGVQSGSYRIRKNIFERIYTNEDIVKQANLFTKYNISVKYDFIFDNPFENSSELEETYSLMRRLPSPKKFNFFSLKFFPNTKITKMALDSKYITGKDLCNNVYIDCFQYGVSKKREDEIYEIIGMKI